MTAAGRSLPAVAGDWERRPTRFWVLLPFWTRYRPAMPMACRRAVTRLCRLRSRATSIPAILQDICPAALSALRAAQRGRHPRRYPVPPCSRPVSAEHDYRTRRERCLVRHLSCLTSGLIGWRKRFRSGWIERVRHFGSSFRTFSVALGVFWLPLTSSVSAHLDSGLSPTNRNPPSPGNVSR